MENMELVDLLYDRAAKIAATDAGTSTESVAIDNYIKLFKLSLEDAQIASDLEGKAAARDREAKKLNHCIYKEMVEMAYSKEKADREAAIEERNYKRTVEKEDSEFAYSKEKDILDADIERCRIRHSNRREIKPFIDMRNVIEGFKILAQVYVAQKSFEATTEICRGVQEFEADGHIMRSWAKQWIPRINVPFIK